MSAPALLVGAASRWMPGATSVRAQPLSRAAAPRGRASGPVPLRFGPALLAGSAGSPDGLRLPPRSAGRRTERGVRPGGDQV